MSSFSFQRNFQQALHSRNLLNDRLIIFLQEDLLHSPPSSTGDFSLGMKLFELYLTLQQFYQQRDEFLFENSQSDLKSGLLKGRDSRETFPYHKWFIRAVAKWLDIALFKVSCF